MKENRILSKYSRRCFSALALCCAAMLPVSSLQADTLAHFDMETSGARHKASFVNSSVSVSELSGSNLNAPASFMPAHIEGGTPGDDYIAWSRSIGSAQTDAMGVIADGTCFSFTIAPAAGKAITLAGISFEAMAGTAGPSDRQFYVMSDRTGYLSTAVLLSASTETGSPLIPYNTATSEQTFFIDLSGNGAFASVTEPVTFRFYIATPTVNQNIGFDDIIISGKVVAVPEPEPVVPVY